MKSSRANPSPPKPRVEEAAPAIPHPRTTSLAQDAGAAELHPISAHFGAVLQRARPN